MTDNVRDLDMERMREVIRSIAKTQPFEDWTIKAELMELVKAYGEDTPHGKSISIALRRIIELEVALEIAKGAMNREQELLQRIAQLEADIAEFQASFDLRWEADRRAIARWQAVDPEHRSHTWPDHADMVEWLLNEDARLRAENAETKTDFMLRFSNENGRLRAELAAAKADAEQMREGKP